MRDALRHGHSDVPEQVASPALNTGIAGWEAGTGQVGAGLVTPPIACFATAVRALAARAQCPYARVVAKHAMRGVHAAPDLII